MDLSVQTINGAATDKLWYFRFKKFDADQYLITNDAGKYHFLSVSDFQKFISWDVESLIEYPDLIKKGFIKNEEYENRMIWSVVKKNHFVGSGPTLHMIVVTLRCNHHCRYCHAAVAPMTAKEFDMTEETAKTVVDTIMFTNSSHLTIEFQWGEALVNYPVFNL